jgi:hypothetical protein
MTSLILPELNNSALTVSSAVPIPTISTISGTSPPLSQTQPYRAELIPRWLPFDPSRNFPDLGPRFIKGERALRDAQRASKAVADAEIPADTEPAQGTGETVREDMDDEVDLSWATVMKRSFEGYIRAERPNMYGEWLQW